jgi:hypothetical protein
VHSPRSNHEFYLYLDGLIYLEFRILANKSESVYDKLKKKEKKSILNIPKTGKLLNMLKYKNTFLTYMLPNIFYKYSNSCNKS